MELATYPYLATGLLSNLAYLNDIKLGGIGAYRLRNGWWTYYVRSDAETGYKSERMMP